MFLKATFKIITRGFSKESLHGKRSCCQPRDSAPVCKAAKPHALPSMLQKPKVMVLSRSHCPGTQAMEAGESSISGLPWLHRELASLTRDPVSIF